mmetsp:Transcript_21349/g.46263  ORF Transcript_21349/g.46263 Transcript_21349/m.46263 type:complete len:96 (+) Transcript_21349:309-596(+)
MYHWRKHSDWYWCHCTQQVSSREQLCHRAHCLIPENKVIPDGSLVVGSPGKVVRQLTEEQIEGLKMGADNYVKNSEWFREALLDDGDGDAVQSKL